MDAEAQMPRAESQKPRQLNRLDGYAWRLLSGCGGSRSQSRGVFISNLSVWQQSGNIIISNGGRGSRGSIKEVASPSILPAPSPQPAPPTRFGAFVVCAWRWIYKLQLIKSWWVCVSEIKHRALPHSPSTHSISKWGSCCCCCCWPERILRKMLCPSTSACIFITFISFIYFFRVAQVIA